MRYAMARYDEKQREAAYRIYVTDGLFVLARGGLNMRYAEIFEPEETRTADEIIGGISAKLARMGGE